MLPTVDKKILDVNKVFIGLLQDWAQCEYLVYGRLTKSESKVQSDRFSLSHSTLLNTLYAIGISFITL